ncbi:ParB/RepB/Spo0J family partition protein [Nocardia sp. SYP-A9097]|uniref:ParB/RepB/Spo0J family partition protein n=1 Tax=Nocardia sp. SYP-A9097 TaxID=2663237 RepID=UPI00129AFC23|nr:ParB/RepB/Spo0J family partition protein [Nocardia sp. SYP-A9097]MRH86306.1 ParB/RepB/Spo0J family partition protein [Nocardia sp. SYP-A9097]
MSQAKKGGLGRGLAALIPTGPAATPGGLGSAAANVVIGLDPIGPQPASAFLHRVPDPAEVVVEEIDAGATYREIPPEQIVPNPKQPRQVFDDEALAELVHSIKEFGLMQPIVVRQVESLPEPRYQLIMGERRWRASQAAGLDAIPAIVRETADDALLRDALLENIHRVQLNPLEEAAAYEQLLEEFGVTHEELASRIGRSRPVVTNMIRLLRLPIPVQRRVAAGVLSAGHARAVLALEAGAEAQEELAKRIVAEGMSVRSTEEAVKLANRNPDAAATPLAPKRKPIQMPGLQDVAERLSESFDTRVTVALGKRKGKITVEFGSIDDLERIVSLMEQSKL